MVRLSELKDIIAGQIVDVQDLVYMLEINIEDILERFPDKIREHKEKFGVTEQAEEDDEA